MSKPIQLLLICVVVGALAPTGISAEAAQAPVAGANPAGRGGNQGGGAGPAPLRSPEVAPDRRVTFRVSAPKAAEVRLTCECLNDGVAMTKDAQGIWSATVGPIEPEMYEYEFTVDGVVIPDQR